eukprot:9493433-Pyramimonas_sp.AAC.1
MLCGSYSQEKVRNLAVKCDPKEHSAGASVLSRLKRGLHPQRNVAVSCAAPERPGSGAAVRAFATASRVHLIPPSTSHLE